MNVEHFEKIIVLNANHSLNFGYAYSIVSIKIMSVSYNFIDSHLDVSNSMWFIVKCMESQWQQQQQQQHIKWLPLPQDIQKYMYN